MISRTAAIFRASFLTATSYRLAMAISLAGLVATVIPVYFIAGAIQPIVEDSIRTQGGQYFAFVLIGMLTLSFVNSACSALPAAVSSGIRTGTFEVMLATPASVPSVLFGMTTYPLAWTVVRGLALVVAGQILGAHFAWGRLLPAVALLALVVLAHLPFGLIGAAMLMVFRTTGPLVQGVVVLSLLLGGVYYPTDVLPGALSGVANLFPLTYGLRAIRRTFLAGATPGDIASDIGVLLLFVLVLSVIGWMALAASLQHARRNGTLGHY